MRSVLGVAGVLLASWLAKPSACLLPFSNFLAGSGRSLRPDASNLLRDGFPSSRSQRLDPTASSPSLSFGGDRYSNWLGRISSTFGKAEASTETPGKGTCPPCPSCDDAKSSAAGAATAELHVGSIYQRYAVDPATAQLLYEDMLRGRVFEDKVAELYFKGKVAGFVHLYNGQEAISTGVLKAMRPDDFAASTYRDHVHALSKGLSPREVMAELFGKQTGCSKGRGGSMHMFSKPHNFVGGFAFIGEQIPVALGLAYSITYRKSLAGRTAPRTTDYYVNPHDQVVACFLGDGTSNIGQFYEALNMASLAKLPIIFVVENNNWAIGMAHYRSTAVPEIFRRGPAFDVPSVEVDGMDVLAVRSVAREAIARARAGRGPTLIEALTYRFRGHSLADPDELRAAPEKGNLLKRDPISLFAEKYLKPNKISSDYLLSLTRRKVRQVIDDAVKFAEESDVPCVDDVAKYVFADDANRHDKDAAHLKDGLIFDHLSESELKEYSDALREERRIKKLTKKERRTLPPVYINPEPLRVIE